MHNGIALARTQRRHGQNKRRGLNQRCGPNTHRLETTTFRHTSQIVSPTWWNGFPRNLTAFAKAVSTWPRSCLRFLLSSISGPRCTSPMAMLSIFLSMERWTSTSTWVTLATSWSTLAFPIWMETTKNIFARVLFTYFFKLHTCDHFPSFTIKFFHFSRLEIRGCSRLWHHDDPTSSLRSFTSYQRRVDHLPSSRCQQDPRPVESCGDRKGPKNQTTFGSNPWPVCLLEQRPPQMVVRRVQSGRMRVPAGAPHQVNNLKV